MLEIINLSYKRIRKNVSKTIYNTIISFLIGLILLFLISISFSSKFNCDNIAKDRFASYDEIIIENGTYTSDGKFISYMSRIDSISAFDNLNSRDDIDDLYFKLIFETNNYFLVYDIKKEVEKGNISLKNNIIKDAGDYVYISEAFAEANGLKAGDKYTDIRIVDKISFSYDFIVADVFNGRSGFPDIILDKSFLSYESQDAYMIRIYVSSIYAKLKKTDSVDVNIRKTKEIIDYLKTSNNGVLNGGSMAYEEYSKISFSGNIFFYVTLAMSIIILLLFVFLIKGMVNVIIDNGRKQLGLLKTLGMRNKDIIISIYVELFISLIVGFLLSTIIFYSLSYVFSNISKNIIFTLLFTVNEGLKSSISIRFYNQLYIPVAILIIVLITVFLSSYRGIKKILIMSPIVLLGKEDI